jgi:hypothetical protein
MKVVVLWSHAQRLPSDDDRFQLVSAGYSKVVGKEVVARMVFVLQDERCVLCFPHTENFVYHLVRA